MYEWINKYMKQPNRCFNFSLPCCKAEDTQSSANARPVGYHWATPTLRDDAFVFC